MNTYDSQVYPATGWHWIVSWMRDGDGRAAGATGIRYSDYIYADPAHPYFSYQPPWRPGRPKTAGLARVLPSLGPLRRRQDPVLPRHVLVARPKLPLRALLARPVRGHLAVAAAAVDVAVAAAAVGLAVAPAAIGLAVAAAIGLAVTAAANDAWLQLSDGDRRHHRRRGGGGGAVLLLSIVLSVVIVWCCCCKGKTAAAAAAPTAVQGSPVGHGKATVV